MGEERAVREISTGELNEILKKHEQWLQDEGKGERANLSAANLSGLNLAGVNLQCANLHQADLRNTSLQDANLKGVNLSFADLSGAYLKGATLRAASMQSVDLSYANLSHADLYSAFLDTACLVNAKLYATDLGSTNLRGVDMRGADLKNTIFQGAFFGGMYRPWFTYVGIGSDYSEILYFVDIDSIKCGCWHAGMGGTLAEFKEWINEAYPLGSKNKLGQQYGLEYFLAIKMFEDMRKEYLQIVKKKNE